MSDFHHVSVLYNETLNNLVLNPNGIYVDCTLGGAGHSAGIAARLSSAGRLIGIDQDPEAIEAAHRVLSTVACRVDIIRSNFRFLRQVLADLEIDAVDGVMYDLGVSSHQLDTAERGFSYMQSAPLDMRMDPENSKSAFKVVNEYEEAELTRIIADYGEERWAKRIASFIAAARRNAPIATTGELVDLIKRAVPAGARRDGPHPAKRTFQAIRIEVNEELEILRQSFTDGVESLKPGGRICIITFHSLEDRIAKQTLGQLAKGCICPPALPICVCNHHPSVKLIGKALAPSNSEIEDNPRSRSAKLRVAQKL